MTLRRVLVVAAFLAAMTSLAPTAAPAAASGCEDGVIVVVDASAFGAGISERCVRGAQGTGLDALVAADHSFGEVPRSPGMVCTIDERPDPCNGAPADAYWSYWHAEQGADSWTYSSRGAGQRSPAPGTAEGWRFGGGSPPGVPPPGGDPEPEPEPEPEAPGPEPKEPSSGSSGSGPPSDEAPTEPDAPESTGSASSSSRSGEPSTNRAEGPSTDRTEEPSPDRDTDGTDRPDDVDPADGPVRLEPDVPIDDTAGYRAPNASAEALEDEQADDEDRATDQVALPDRDDAPPVGLVAGGGLIAGLVGLTVLQVRRRRLEG